MRFPLPLAVLILLFAGPPAEAAENGESVHCAKDPRIVGQCFRTYGNLLMTASRGASLGIDGTGREFLIVGKTNPEILNEIFNRNFTVSVHGLFEVCPFHGELLPSGFYHYGCIASVEEVLVDSYSRGSECEIATCK